MNEIIKPNIPIEVPRVIEQNDSGGGWDFYSDHAEEWYWCQDAFMPDELDAIIEMGQRAKMDKGITGRGTLSEFRDSYVSWLFPNEVTSWVFRRMETIVKTINNDFYGFDLYGFLQGLQFTKYTAPGQHYTWHVDRGRGMGVRKLSVSLLLSDPDDYEGGDLQLKFGEQEETVQRVRGMATFFPSWTLHRVTPVTKGTRYSLVAWVSGPPFK